MKYYLIAGEASGDMHAANLMEQIKTNDSKAEFRFWGGDQMQKQGGFLVKHYKTYNHMGITEVIKHLRTILNNIKNCKADIAQYKPDMVIYIDFSGFNMKLVKFVHELGIRSVYYILPSVWAWDSKRAYKIMKYVSHSITELPFVETFFKEKFQYKVDYVGHPLLDSIAKSKNKFNSQHEFRAYNQLPNKRIIALLPGSREAEIRFNLKIIQEIAEFYPSHQFVVAGMSRFSNEDYKKYISAPNVSVLFDLTYELLRNAEVAVVVSGTATLETAIIGTPFILVYRTTWLTYFILKMAVKIKYIGLPNLIMNKPIIPELIQHKLTTKNLQTELDKLLFDSDDFKKQQREFVEMRSRLGGEGASKRAADLIAGYLK